MRGARCEVRHTKIGRRGVSALSDVTAFDLPSSRGTAILRSWCKSSILIMEKAEQETKASQLQPGT